MRRDYQFNQDNPTIHMKNLSAKEITQEKGAKVFRWSLIIFAGLALIVIVGPMISVAYYDDIEAIDQFMSTARPWLSAWRLLLFVIVIGGWRHWTAVYAKWAGLTDDQWGRMFDYRWRMALWLLMTEAVFTQGVLTEFINNVITMESDLL
jgi:hypothetical protein